MPGGEWIDIAVKAAIGLASGFFGMLVGAWKWGKDSAKAEQAVKEDYETKINAVRDEGRVQMAAQIKSSDDSRDLLAAQFRESFEGLRRQMDEHRLDTEKRFLLKDDFREFLKEYRDDQRRTDTKLDRLLETRQ